MATSTPALHREPSSSAHPSHPGLSSARLSRPSHAAGPPPKSTGALGALSTILLGHTAQRSVAVSGKGRARSTSREPTLLARRRGLEEEFDLGPGLGMSFLRPREELASGAAGTGEDDDIPSIGRDVRRSRSRLATQELADEGADLPPSPLGLPGEWTWDESGKKNKDGALLLPPPFLDEGSSRDSFEGLLGTRTARELARKDRREARQLARDRPPPPAFPASLLRTASKLVFALGPPGGISSAPFYRSWKDDPDDPAPASTRKERRRIDRAETGMKGFEFGEKFAARIASKLRKQQDNTYDGVRIGVEDLLMAHVPDQPSPLVVPTTLRAATPMSLFAPSDGEGGHFATLLSPPLPVVPHRRTTSTSNTSTPSLVPLKPKLGPVEPSDVELSPLPLEDGLQGFKSLEELSPLVPAQLVDVGMDDGYFSIDKMSPILPPSTLAPPTFVSLDEDTPPVLLVTLPPTPAVVPSTHFLSSSQEESPGSDNRALFTIIAPFTFAAAHLERLARQNIDFLVWAAVGSISPGTSRAEGMESVGGLLGLVLNIFGFAFFLVIHSGSLVVSTLATLRSITLVLHWAFLNLTGRTDLSVVAYEYLVLCRHEWDRVYAEDGVKMNAWSVGIGLLEMAAVQAMSRERWLTDGPGDLELMNGEEEDDGDTLEVELALGSPMMRRRSMKRRKSLGAGTVERPGFARKRTTRRWIEDEGEGESLLVTGGADSILEGEILNDSFDPVAHLSPSTQAWATTDELDDLPPLDIGDTLPGFSFPPSPIAFNSPRRVSIDTPTSPPLRPVPSARPLPAILKTIKRHVRLATASYGLHSYILAPPTPLFTPSGTNLPGRIFSHLGGIDGKNVLHVAIQKDYLSALAGSADDDTYEPQIYLLRDDVNCEVVLVIRGSQSLSDIKVDLEGSLGELELPRLEGEGTETYRAHEGILTAARTLLNPETSPLFVKLKAALESHPGYALVLVGHSLGGGIASLVAVLLGIYNPPPPSSSSSAGHWTTNLTSGLPPHRPLRAICFAHPTTVDTALSLRCAMGSEPLVLSVSLGGDVVCRMGVAQVREVRRTLGRLAKRRRRLLENEGDVEGDGKKGKGKEGRSEVLSAWWRWKQLGGGELSMEDVSEGVEEEKKSIEERAWGWRKVMDGLSKEGDEKEGVRERRYAGMMIPAGKALHIDRLPPQLERKRKTNLQDLLTQRALLRANRALNPLDQDSDDDEEEEDDDGEESQVWGLYAVKKPTGFFACPLLVADLVQVHLPRFYLDAIESL